jgi:hypothetical protein
LVRADQDDVHQPADLAVEGPKVVALNGPHQEALTDMLAARRCLLAAFLDTEDVTELPCRLLAA